MLRKLFQQLASYLSKTEYFQLETRYYIHDILVFVCVIFQIKHGYSIMFILFSFLFVWFANISISSLVAESVVDSAKIDKQECEFCEFVAVQNLKLDTKQNILDEQTNTRHTHWIQTFMKHLQTLNKTLKIIVDYKLWNKRTGNLISLEFCTKIRCQEMFKDTLKLNFYHLQIN